jgi:hypothetical protein
MQRNRLLYTADRLLASLAVARNTLAAEYQAELEEMRREVDDIRQATLLLTRIERERCESDLAELRRELEAALLRLAQRDGTPLH